MLAVAAPALRACGQIEALVARVAAVGGTEHHLGRGGDNVEASAGGSLAVHTPELAASRDVVHDQRPEDGSTIVVHVRAADEQAIVPRETHEIRVVIVDRDIQSWRGLALRDLLRRLTRPDHT